MTRLDVLREYCSMRSRFFWPALLVGLLCWGIVTATQYLSGSFGAELHWSVDEPAHYVSGMMVAEYFRNGMPENPMRFAENYYVHYPKVAIGSWPPVFYGLQGIWGVLFGSSKVSILLLIGLLMGAGSAVIFQVARDFAGSVGAAALAMAYVLVPVSRWISSMIMAEPLIALGAIGAALSFAAFLESATLRRGMLYGLFVSVTILTKGTGVALILIPSIAILITRNWRLLFTYGLWAAATIVVVLGGIWTFITLRIVSEGWTKQAGIGYALNAAVQAPWFVWTNLGTLVVGLALLGAWRTLAQRTATGVAMLATVLGVFIFYTIPPIGLEERYFHVVVPMVLILAAMGFEVVAKVLHFRYVRETLAALMLTVSLGHYLPVPVKTHYGIDQAASYLVTKESQDCVVLMSSYIDLEGMFIAEMALQQHMPKHYLIRSSKVLARSNWSGTDYRLLYTDSRQVHDFLEQSPISLIVTTTFPQHGSMRPDHSIVREVLLQYSGDWEKILSIPSPVEGTATAAVEMYRHRQKRCAENPHIEVDMGSKLQRSFRN